jgi:hypothetical protein
MRVLSLFRPHRLAALGALLIVLAAAPAASAYSGSCPYNGPIEQVFLQDFGDPLNYYLTPGGAFEDGAWDGGTLVEENEPWFVRSSSDRRSMAVSGGPATSPKYCVSPEDPTLRFFARRTAGSPLSALGIAVVVLGPGKEHRIPLVPVVQTSDEWSVTTPRLILANLIGLYTGEATRIQLQFTASPGSAWQVDDVYVDPYRRH